MPRLCGGMLLIGRPPRLIRPCVATSNPASIIRQVVLPEPDGAEHRQELAARDVEVQILDDERFAVIALLDSVEFDECAVALRHDTSGCQRFSPGR